PGDSTIFYFLLIANIVRFYHGNIRLLDDNYGSTASDNGRRRSLGIDFFVIFFQSIMFSMMSFYIGKDFEFFALFTALLLLDVVWYLLTLGFAGDLREFKRQRNWTVNNVLAVIALFAITNLSAQLGQPLYFDVQASIMGVNTVV